MSNLFPQYILRNSYDWPIGIYESEKSSFLYAALKDEEIAKFNSKEIAQCIVDAWPLLKLRVCEIE